MLEISWLWLCCRLIPTWKKWGLPHHHLSAGLLVLMQDWAFLRRCLVLNRPNTLDSMIISMELLDYARLDHGYSRFSQHLIKFILVWLAKPFSYLSIVTFLRLESARSSSFSCCPAFLAWAKGPTALLYDTCSSQLLGWPLCLGETLPPCNSKDKKCCLYETPYFPAHVRKLGDFLDFFLFTSDVFLKRSVLSYWDSYVLLLHGSPLTKAVPDRTTLHAWGVLQK